MLDEYHPPLVVAVNDQEEAYEYPAEVKFEIRQNHQRDYIQAADYINYSGADICVLEHEFGIYGGDNGIYVLSLIHRLNLPLVVTFHTVLKDPSYNEKIIIQALGKRAQQLVVMSKRAVAFLTEIYQVPAEKIRLIEHGVPDYNLTQLQTKQKFNLEDKKVLLTFGLLSRNKGIETVLNALPKLVKKHPHIFYIVLGKTHPNVLRHAGEEYRNYLNRMVKKLDVSDHVYFYNQFVEQNELFEYLSAADIYITPYLNEAQITSGTLSYAIGAGAAVLSTPYWHAQELLADGRGRLFGFNNSEELAGILDDLLSNPEELKLLREKAYEYGRHIIWPSIGSMYLDQFKQILQSEEIKHIGKKEIIIDPLVLPKFDLTYVRRISDSTGIFQHGKYGIPNWREGYCIDDVARALLMVTMAFRQKKYPEALDLIPVYMGYIHYMQRNDGSFKNFLGYNRQFLDEKDSEDAFGRTIWALGYLQRYAPTDSYHEAARELFFKALPVFSALQSIRGIANTVIGISHYLKIRPADDSMMEILNSLANKLCDAFDKNQSEDWQWFEAILSYDNGILPLALFHAAEITFNERFRKTAFNAMHFLESKTLHDGYLSLVGSNGWYPKNGKRAMYDQQPIDAMATVMMYFRAFLIDKETKYLEKMFQSFMWFLGENDLHIPLYDFETKGCCDGLMAGGVNRNQGAESTLAYLLSHLTVLHGHEIAN